MIKIKNFLVFGAIKSVFKFIGKILYKILRLLNLELILLYGIIGLILELGWGLITKTHTSYVIYHVLAAVILLYAILNTIIKILHLGSRKAKKGKTVQIVSEEVKEEPKIQIVEEANKNQEKIKSTKVPKYFRVAQNPKYIMAEYEDRVELFYESSNGLKHIRTDYK